MRTTLSVLTLAGVILGARGTFAQQQPPPAVAQVEDFQSYGAPRQPPGWKDFSLGSPNASGLYKTRPDPTQGNKGSNIVYGTKQSSGHPDGNKPKIGSFSILTTKTFAASGRFEYRGRFIRTNDDSRIGLVFFTSLTPAQELNAYYLLGLWKNPSDATLTMQLFPSGDWNLTGTTNSNFTPEKNKWYRFLIQTDDTNGATQVRARFWLDGSTEPTTFSIDASDATATRLTSGFLGLWAAVRGDAYVDDLNAKSPVDFTPPTIALFESGVQLDPAIETKVGHEALLEARALDALSGTAQTTLTIDGNPYTALTPYSVEGSHTFRAVATDHAGNTASLDARLLIDLTPPAIQLTESGQPLTGTKFNRPIAIVFGATDTWTGATATAKLDDQPYTSGTPITANGVHHLSVKATDGVGHESTVNVTLLIDESKPVIAFRESANVVSGSVAFNRNPSIEIVVTDPHSSTTVTSTIGAQPYVSLTPITIDGRYTIHVVAVDDAGNSAEADLNVLVDKVAPVVELRESNTLLDPSVVAKFNRDAAIDVAISDATSTVTKSITLDGAPYVSGTPITTEETHTLLVRVEDEAHNVTEVRLSVLIDKSAPRIEFREGGVLLDDAVLQKFRRDAVLDISAIDDVSSATFTATLDGAPYSTGTPITTEQLHEVKVEAIDLAGNHANATLRLLVDKTPPVIHFTESGAPLDPSIETALRRPALVGVDVTDNLPGVHFTTKLDGSDYTPGTPIATDGHHVVTVVATDAADNEVTATARLLIDQTGPAIVFREGTRVLDPATRQLFNHTPPIHVDVTDELSTVTPTITLAGAPFASGSVVAEGIHTLHVRAVDALGNEMLADLRMLVDATRPVVTLTTGGQTLSPSGRIFNHDIVVTASVQDLSETTVTATLNDDAFALALPIAAERQHTLVVTAVDELQWSGSATSTFIIDKTAPKISLFETAGGTRKPLLSGDSFARAVTIVADADDLTHATLTAKIDNVDYTLGTPYAVDGEHTLVVNGVDEAGNVSTPLSLRFLIDRNAPEVTLLESAQPYAGGKTFPRDVVFTTTVHAATTPTTTVTIDGQEYTTGTPYGVEGHHTIVVSATNVAGTTTVTAAFSIDKTDPTIALFAGDTPFANDLKFSADFVLRAVAADNLANPPRVVITLDGQVVPNNTTIAQEGFHDVQATVTDDAERSVTVGLYHFVLDKTDPELEVKVDGVRLEDHAKFNKAITPQITADDLTTPVITATLNDVEYVRDTLIEADGFYTLKVSVRDALDHVTTLEPLHFVIDKTPPIVVVKENGVVFTGGQFDRNVTPTLDITDLTATTQRALLDGNPYVPGQEISSEGKHRLEITVTDELLWDTVVPPTEFTIDKSAPEVTINESGQPLVSGTIFNREARPKIDVHDTTQATVTAKLDGADFVSETPVSAEQLHVLNVKVADELGHETIVPTIEFVVDRSKPVLTLTENGVALVSGAKLDHDAVPHLVVTDLTHTDVVATLDGDAYTLDTAVTAEGPHTLSIVVTDAAGWTTELTDVRFFIDKTRPVITVKVNGADLQSGDEFKVSIAPQIDITDISETTPAFTLDGQSYARGAEIAAEGTHVLTVSAKDALGWETVVGPLSFIIDKTAPVVTVKEQGVVLVTGRKFDRAVTPTLDIVDLTKTTTDAKIDGQPWSSGTPIESEGNHVLTGTVTDNLQQTTTLEPLSFFIDRTPPVVRVKANDQLLVSGAAFGDHARITIEVDDITEATIDAKLNGVAFTSGTDVTDEAQYTLNVTVTDEVGGTTTVPAITFYLDKTAPVVELIEGTRPDVRPLTDGQWFNRTVLADANVTDTTATTKEPTLLFNGNARAFALGDALTEEGTYTLSLKVTDAVGRITNAGPVTFHIDLRPPDITFLTPPAESTVVSPQLIVTGKSDDAVSVDVNGIESTIDAATKTYVTSAPLDLLEGANAIVALGIDRAGNNTTIGMNVFLDTRAPQLTITSPATDACIKANDVVVRGTIGDAGVVTVKVSIGDNTPIDATLSGREWSVTLPLPIEGKQTIKVVAIDPSGHNATATLPITVDRTKPVIDVIENGVPFLAPIVNRPVALFVRVQDATLTVTLNGAPYVSGTTLTSDGAYELKATAVDCAGNASDEKIVHFIIDRTPPAITSVTPANNSTIATKPPITGNLSEPALVFVESTSQQATISGTSFSLAYALEEGTNAFVLVARDAAGNSSRLPYQISIRTTAPTIEIVENGSAIAPNAIYRRSVTPELRSSDPDATFTATLNGNAFTSRTTIADNGSYTLTAKARDAFGHESPSATATFTIDRSGPAVNITTPAALAQIVAATVVVSGTYSDAQSVTVNGVVASLTSGTFSATIPLDLGENMLIALATDASGNTATDQVVVTRPRGAIAILLKSPPHGLITNRPTLPVAGQVVTIAEAQTVTVNGQSVETDPAGNFFVPEFTLVEGDNEIKATVVSKSGQSNSATAMVKADFTPPELTVLANAIELTDGARFAISPELTIHATDANNAAPVTRFIVDGSPANAPVSGLANGGHSISAFARDAAGNETRVDRTLFVGSGTVSSGCGFSNIEPLSESAVSGAAVRINGRSGGAVRVLINGVAADVADGSFCGSATLQPGRNVITIECADANGAPTSDAPYTLVLDRYDEPEITINTPAPGAQLTTNKVTVSGTVSAGVISGDVNGIRFDVPAGATEHTFNVEVPLASGLNVLAVRARTASQRAAVKTVRVRFAAVNSQLIITSPLPGSQTGATSVDVSGTYANLDPSTITVNGQSAIARALSDTSGTFRVATVPIATNVTTTITATAGAITSTTDVKQTDAPSIVIAEPLDNTFVPSTFTNALHVTGTIANAGDTPQVQVNGVNAALSGATFSADVPLAGAGGGITPIVARVTSLNGSNATDAVRVIKFAKAFAVTETFPAAATDSVDPGVVVLALFSTQLDAATAANAARLTDAAGETVPGDLYVDRDTIAFAPHAALRFGASYTLTIGTSLRDATGASLAAPHSVGFTVASTAPAAPPELDEPDTTGCFDSYTVTGRASKPGARVRLDVDGVTLTTTAAANSTFSFRFAFSGQPGYHSVRVRQLGDDGTLSAERAFCVLVNCAPPTVVGATLDRTASTLQIQFSKPMNLTTLTASPVGSIAITPDGATTLTGTVALNAAGNVATVTLPALPEKDIALLVKKSVVKDASGLALSADYTQRFPFAAGPPVEQGKGYVAGAVYDATTGRPLANAQVEIVGDTTLITSERGRYSRSLPEGAYTIRAAAAGFTTVWRQIVVPVGAGVVPIDIRLTARGAEQTATGAALTLTHGGDTAVTKKTTLALTAPSLVPGTRVRLTAIGAQSLAGLLPLGWSPLASAEIVVDESSDPASLPGAQLTFTLAALPANTALSLARYDRERDEWRVIAAVAANNTFDIDSSGNYALVYPDNAPHLAKPPAARGGAVLAGVTSTCAASPETCTLTRRSFVLDPPTVLPNGRTVATLTTEGAGAAQTYPSGTAVQAFIDEQLNLADGRVLVDPPFATDLLLYRSLAGDTGVADFHLAPTPQAAAVILRDGVDHIRVVDYPGRIDRGTLVGADGGRVPGDDRVSLDIPRGAVAEPLHASVVSLTDSDLARLGNVAGFRVAGGFRFSLTRTNPPAPQEGVTYAGPQLLKSASASLFVSGSASQVIVAEVLPRTPFGVMLRLAAIASPASNQNVFVTRTIPFSTLPIDGITRNGEYLVLVPDVPIAYAYGNVRHGGAGTAVEDARVTSGIGAPITQSLGVTDLTRIDGNFVVPVAAKPAAIFSLLPRSPVSGDGAVRLASASPDPDTYVNFGVLPLTIQPPRLVSLTPADGAMLDVTTAFLARAQFDVPIDSASATGGLRIVDVTTGAALAGTISVNGSAISFNLGEALRPATRYAITIAPTIRATNGAPFGQTVVHQFSTHALPPGNTAIRPELIRITIPDASGKSTISGAPGALPAGAQAIAVRRGRLFVVSYQTEVTNANGSFSFDAGHRDARDRISIEDAIDLQILDAVSRSIIAVIELTPFVDADGRGFIVPPNRATHFTSADGITVNVAEGTFDAGTPLRVTTAAKDTASEVTNFDQELTFHAGVRIDFTGTAKKRIDLELPAPANTNPDYTYVLGRLGDSARGPRIELVDILRVEGNKFTTTSVEEPNAKTNARVATNAGAGVLVNKDAKKWLLGIVRSGIHYALDLKVNQPYWAFIEPLNVGIEMHWSLYQSLFVSDFYMTESRGRIAIPVAPNVPFTVVGIDAASGLRSFEKLYNLTATDPNIPVEMDPPDPDKHGPYPVYVSPGGVDFLDVADEDEPLETVYYAVDLNGTTAIVGHNPKTDAEQRLKPKTTLQLLNTRTGHTAFATVSEASTFSVSITAENGDRIAVLRGGVDVPAESVISIAFNEPLKLPPADPARTDFLRDNVKLRIKQKEAGAPAVDITQQVIFDPDSGDRRLNLTLPASALSSGVTYELELRTGLTDTHDNPLGRGLVRSGDTTSNNGGDQSFRIDFLVREPAGLLSEFELQPSELYKGGTIRDFASYGNIVFVSALDGGVLAYDGADPGALDGEGGTQPKPFAYVPGHWKDEQGNTIIRGADQHWAVTTDHHGRVYSTMVFGDFTLVRGYRVEDFLKAKTESMCDVNLPNALCRATGSAIIGWRLGYSSTLTTISGILVSDRVEAIPRKLQVLLQDEQVDLDYDELRQAYNATVQAEYANEFRKLRVPFTYNSPDPYLSQRVTVENLTTGMKWSADVKKNGGGAVEGVLARPGDKLRVYRNVRTYGVISQMGYGVGVYDLNAIESNDADNKPADYQLLREQINVTPAGLADSCWPDIADLDPFSTDAISDLSMSPDHIVLPDPADPARALIYAPSVNQGLLGIGVNLQPSVDRDKKDCVDRRHGLLLHHGAEWHPRLQPIVEAYGGAPIARFQQVAHYRPVYDAGDGVQIPQDYILVAGGQVGLLAISPNRPAGSLALHEDLEEASLAGLVWVPKGVFGVRMIPGTHLAAVVDGKRRLLIIDLTNIDERFDEKGNPIAEDALFPTALKALHGAPAEAGEIGSDDPRILWASEPDAVFGTLVPLVDPDTGIAFVGDVTTKKMRIVAAINPKVRIVADLGNPNGLDEVTTVIPMGVPLDEFTKQRLTRSETASASAFRVEMTLPGGLAKALRDAGHEGVEIAIESELVPGALAPQTPDSLPKAHLRTKKPNGQADPRDTRLVLRRDLPVDAQGKEIPELADANRHQKGFNRFVSPWIFALADPRAAKDYDWGANDAKEKREESGCYACVRPDFLKEKEEPLVYELYTAGRLLSIGPNLDLFKNTKYEYLGEKSRTELHVPTVMADTVRPTEVLVAAQQPPVADGLLQETTFLHSGEVDTTAVDIDAGGRADWHVVLGRVYRSRTLGATAFGAGWDSDLFRRVRPLPNGDVEYRDGSEVWRFRKTDTGFEAPKGLFLKLTRTGQGWIIIDQQWRVTTFDDYGRIVSEADEFYKLTDPDAGNVIRYAYDANSRLAKIIDPVGRVTSLKYYDENSQFYGRVEEVSDWHATPRKIGYQYDDEGRLKKVELSEVENTSHQRPRVEYTYKSVGASYSDQLELSGNLETIRQPNEAIAGGPPRIKFTYGTSGNDRDHATKQEWGTGESATFSYGSATNVTTKDVLGQERTYVLTEVDKSDPYADRVHVKEATDVSVEVWAGAAFGQLPDTLTAGAPNVTTQDRKRTFTFDDGVLQSSAATGVSNVTLEHQKASGAPGVLLKSINRAPAGGGGGSAFLPPSSALNRTFLYQAGENATTFLRGIEANGARIEALAPHRNVTEPVSTNNEIASQEKYDKSGQLLESSSTGGTDTASAGAKQTIEYWPADAPLYARALPKVVRDGEDLITTFEYPSENQTRSTDSRGVVTTFDYDNWGRVTRLRVEKPGDPLVIEQRFSFDATGRTVEEVQTKGTEHVTTSTSYDVMGRPTRVSIDQIATVGSLTTTTVHDLANRKVVDTRASGSVVTTETDALGRVKRSLTTTGGSPIEARYAYDLAGNRVFMTDMFAATATAYDAHGRAIATRDSDGTIVTTTYDDFSNPKTVRSLTPDGTKVLGETQLDYTEAGRLKSIDRKIDDSHTRSTSLSWDGGGRTTGVATSGRASKMQFDVAGRLLKSISGSGSTAAVNDVLSELDITRFDGELPAATTFKEKNGGSYSSSADRDTAGNVVRESVGPLEWKRKYDELGNITQASVPGRPATSFDVDARGAVVKETLPGGAENKYAYDTSGARSGYTDPENEVTATDTDLIGRPVKRSYADGTEEKIEWEGARLKSFTDRQQRKQTFVYNAKGQIIEVRDDGNQLLDVLQYDDAGRIVSWKNADAEVTRHDFDLDGKPRRTVQRRFRNSSGLGAAAEVLDEFTQEHRWNELGEREAFSMPVRTGTSIGDGWTKWLRQTFDAAGNITSIQKSNDGANAGAVFMNATYRAAGRPQTRTVFAGAGGNTSPVPIVRQYGYQSESSLFDSLTVSARGIDVAGSTIAYDGLQVSSARLLGISRGERQTRWQYDGRSRVASSLFGVLEASDPAAAVPGTASENLTEADFRTAEDRTKVFDAATASLLAARGVDTTSIDPPKSVFTKVGGGGHKLASVARASTTFSYAYHGAERVDDGRFIYEFDAKGRLVRATEKATVGPIRRITYSYTGHGRLVGRSAHYATGTPTSEADWKREDRDAVLASDGLPAETTFVWDTISDRLVAVYDAAGATDANGGLLKQIIHGGAAYDDPLETTTRDAAGALTRLYPIYDEAGAGSLQAVLNENGEVVGRNLPNDVYGSSNVDLVGAAIERISIEAKKDSTGAVERIDVTIRGTEQLAAATIQNGGRLAIVDSSGAVVRLATQTPAAVTDDAYALRWTLSRAQWEELIAATTDRAALSIAVDATLRATAWPLEVPVMAAPRWAVATRSIYTSAALPVELRESLASLSSFVEEIPAGESRVLVPYEVRELALLGVARGSKPLDQLVSARLHAHPLTEPATGLNYVRARWYDASTGTWLSPDPRGYVDSPNLYSFAGGDPVNRRDPTGTEASYTKRGWIIAWHPETGEIRMFDPQEIAEDPQGVRKYLGVVAGVPARRADWLMAQAGQAWAFANREGLAAVSKGIEMAKPAVDAIATTLYVAAGFTGVGGIAQATVALIDEGPTPKNLLMAGLSVGGLGAADDVLRIGAEAENVATAVQTTTKTAEVLQTTEKVGVVAQRTERLLLGTGKLVKHHIFNKFRGKSPRTQKYRDFFAKHNINVDDFTVQIPEAFHKKWIHGAGRNWTTRWKKWIDAHPNATTKEVYQFGGQLMDEYGLGNLPIIPY